MKEAEIPPTKVWFLLQAINIALATSSLMITIKTENYNHISQDFYNKIIDSLDLTLISCTCGHSGSLIRHGSYKRKIPLKDRIITLTVVRVYCKHCGHTHALLLSSFVPYSQIPLTVHISSILACEQNSSIRPVLAGQCCVAKTTSDPSSVPTGSIGRNVSVLPVWHFSNLLCS